MKKPIIAISPKINLFLIFFVFRSLNFFVQVVKNDTVKESRSHLGGTQALGDILKDIHYS